MLFVFFLYSKRNLNFVSVAYDKILFQLSLSDTTPSFSELFILDAVLARLQVTLDEACQKGEIDLRSSEGLDLFQALKVNPDQVPVTGLLQLIQILAKTTR